MPPRQLRIGITMGDAAGIGPEVVVRALAGGRVPRGARLVLYGSPAVFDAAARHAAVDQDFTAVNTIQTATAVMHGMPCINPTRLKRAGAGMGRVEATLARAAMDCVSAAVADALAGELDAVVTAPINKLGLRRAGYAASGHTDFIAAEVGAACGGRTPNVAMLFVGGGLRVALVTIHEPLSNAIKLVTTRRVFTTIGLMRESLERDFGIASPRIGVCGLNPHAGESGLMGNEEGRRIVPAIRMARACGLDVQGPLPADTLIARHHAGEFDGVVAMYHDQGLIAVKLLAFHSGVNVTLGLPFVRTSPDHGTAYDIAPKFAANPGSMEAAIRLAARLARQRSRRTRGRRTRPC
ncbi:MAG: 4-hydroxythreonine-4-phosphate dehydrogenase PdxA [Verrucomicrobia bacterium]|nr:4-hydroxythreonine-4-phosphate dehydrogenase PdxA [Verrucomicrobiota bacterium]